MQGIAGRHMGRALAPVALALAGLLLAASCGDAGASKVVPVQDLAAEVCTDREGRDASLYVRNLGDTSWSSPAISVTKSGREYELGLDPRSKQQYEEILADWPPESVDPTDPLDTPRHFVFKGRSSDPKDPMYGQEQVPLTNFTHLESAKVVVTTPYPAEWTGEVGACG